MTVALRVSFKLISFNTYIRSFITISF